TRVAGRVPTRRRCDEHLLGAPGTTRTCDPLLRSGPESLDDASLNEKRPGQTAYANPSRAAWSCQLPPRNGTGVAREPSPLTGSRVSERAAAARNALDPARGSAAPLERTRRPGQHFASEVELRPIAEWLLSCGSTRASD